MATVRAQPMPTVLPSSSLAFRCAICNASTRRHEPCRLSASISPAPSKTVLLRLILILALVGGTAGKSPPSSATRRSPFGVHRGGGSRADENESRSSVLSDLRAYLSIDPQNDRSDGGHDDGDGEASSAAAAFTEAVGDRRSDGGIKSDELSQDDDHGTSARRFFEALSSSPAFSRDYWHKRPLLVRCADYTGDEKNHGGQSSSSSWADGSFTVDRDLKLVGGSYVTGHRTSDALRDGTKTDTWDFCPIKDDAARQTTWEDVESSLRPGGGGGTIYFNNAGSLWPSLAALCRLAGAPSAFGLPVSVNVYVTPPGTSTSVPPHTDRQDVLVIQTEGAKRWRVFAPPRPRKPGVDPLNRGKGGDVMGFGEEEDLGDGPLIDAVVRRGDVLYVPAGFPHTTDTCTVVPDGERGGAPEREEKEEDVFHETSVHLTLGLDTHVWGLTYAHMRWSALQRAGKSFNIRIESDEDYWNSLETIPCGFLARGMGEEEAVDLAVRELKRVMVQIEPHRWQGGSDGGGDEDGKEDLPPDEDLADVVKFMLHDHLGALLKLQREEMFSGVVDPRGEETLLKAYRCTNEMNKIMEKFGAFSKNEAMRKSFKASRLQREALTKGAAL